MARFRLWHLTVAPAGGESIPQLTLTWPGSTFTQALSLGGTRDEACRDPLATELIRRQMPASCGPPVIVVKPSGLGARDWLLRGVQSVQAGGANLDHSRRATSKMRVTMEATFMAKSDQKQGSQTRHFPVVYLPNFLPDAEGRQHAQNNLSLAHSYSR
jgi:hypothetical protein